MVLEVQSIKVTQENKVKPSKYNKDVMSSASVFETKCKNSSNLNIRKQSPSAIAYEIASEIFKFGTANLDKPLSKITPDNVFEVLDEYKKISDEKNSFCGVLMDDETLFEAILDETISKEKKKEYINYIKTMMEKSIARDQGSTEVISKEFDKAIKSTLESCWPFLNPDKLNKCAAELKKIKVQINSLKKASGEKVAGDSTAAYQYMQRNNLQKSYPDILGDGKFNNKATQISGTCWLHAGINAMLKTKKGREFLNNIVYKNHENGNISVYLKEAKEEGLPQGRKDGIYTYNKNEICIAANIYSRGDGDYSALMLAINDYVKNTKKQKLKLSDIQFGGSTNQFWRIMFGENVNSTVLSKGRLGNPRDVDALYNKIKKSFQEEQGVILVMLAEGAVIPYDFEDNESSFLLDEHGYSIENITDTHVYLTDSTRPGKPIKISKECFIKEFSTVLYKF